MLLFVGFTGVSSALGAHCVTNGHPQIYVCQNCLPKVHLIDYEKVLRYFSPRRDDVKYLIQQKPDPVSKEINQMFTAVIYLNICFFQTGRAWWGRFDANFIDLFFIWIVRLIERCERELNYITRDKKNEGWRHKIHLFHWRNFFILHWQKSKLIKMNSPSVYFLIFRSVGFYHSVQLSYTVLEIFSRISCGINTCSKSSQEHNTFIITHKHIFS